MIELKLRPSYAPPMGASFLNLDSVFASFSGFLATILALGMSGSQTVGHHSHRCAVGPGRRCVVPKSSGRLTRKTVHYVPPRSHVHQSPPDVRRLTMLRRSNMHITGRARCREETSRRLPVPGDIKEETMSALGRVGRGFRRHFLRYLVYHPPMGSALKVEIRRVRDWNADFRLPQTLASTIGVPLEESPI